MLQATLHHPTTAQSLGSFLKSARDILCKDKGLNGDLDRLPLLTWIMVLKFLDDLEIQREQEDKLAGKKFKSAIEAPPTREKRFAINLPNILKVPAISQYGNVNEIIEKFGGPDQLRDAVNQLQLLLYAA